MTHMPTPPVWGSPPGDTGGDQRDGVDLPDAQPESPVADGSPSWQLRRDIASDSDKFRHRHIEVFVGTEEDAMDRLLDVALDEIYLLIKPSKGFQVTREGTSIVVSPVKRGWSEVDYLEYRFTAARILMTVPPIEK